MTIWIFTSVHLSVGLAHKALVLLQKNALRVQQAAPILLIICAIANWRKKKGYRVVLVDLQSHTSPQAGSVVRRPPLEPSDFPLLKRKKKS